MKKMSEYFKENNDGGKFSTTTIDIFEKLETRADKVGVSWVKQLSKEYQK